MSTQPTEEPAEPDEEFESCEEFDEPGEAEPELLAPPGYIFREEAIQQLGSKATVERRVKSKELRTKELPRDGKKPLRVYLAADIETLKRTKHERREAQPPSAKAAAAETTALEPRRSSSNGVPVPYFQELVKTLRELAITQQQLQQRIGQLEVPPAQVVVDLQVPLQHKLWLSMREAHVYSGLPTRRLRKLLAEEIIVAVGEGRGTRILRKSLEAFEG
jgi:chemotaxis protein histidine kinase CheA